MSNAILLNMLDNALAYHYLGGFTKKYTSSLPVNSFPNSNVYNVNFLLLPIFMCLGFSSLLSHLVEVLVCEKEKGIKNHLKLVSLDMNIYWLSHFAVDLFFSICVVFISLGILFLGVSEFSKTNFFVLFLPTFLFSAVMIAYAYLFSFLFRKRDTAAAWINVIITLVVIVPNIFQFLFEGANDSQFLLALIPNWPYQRAVEVILQSNMRLFPFKDAFDVFMDKELFNFNLILGLHLLIIVILILYSFWLFNI